jgi:hypothetical protein
MYEAITDLIGITIFGLIILSGIIYVVESIKDMFKK